MLAVGPDGGPTIACNPVKPHGPLPFMGGLRMQCDHTRLSTSSIQTSERKIVTLREVVDESGVVATMSITIRQSPSGFGAVIIDIA